MERKFTTQDVANELGNTVAIMATSSFNLIAAGALLFSFGVYVDNAKAADVRDTLNKAMDTLGYNRSSKYALAGACVDLARRMVKDHGRPDNASPAAYWLALGEADNAKDAIALIVADIKATYGADTVRDLYAALKGEVKAKSATEKTVMEKVEKAMDGASGDERAQVAKALVPDVQPSDAKAVLLNLVGKLTTEELHEVMASMMAMVDAATDGEVNEAIAA